jgi:ATPase family protein associated with various cellular activities (AAA)
MSGTNHRRHLDLHGAAVVCRLLRLLHEAADQGLFPRDEADRRIPSLAAAADELAGRDTAAGDGAGRFDTAAGDGAGRFDTAAGDGAGRFDTAAGDGAGRFDTAVGDGAGRPDTAMGGLSHEDGPEGLRFRADELAAADPSPLPLARLAAFGEADGAPAGNLAVEVVVAAALVEHDVRVGAAVAALQGSSTSRRPCVGLLARMLGRGADEVAQLVAWLAASGFLVVENPDDPRADQTVRPAPTAQLVLDGKATSVLDLTTAADAPGFADLVLPDEVAARVRRAAALLAGGELDSLVVRGAPGTGRRTVLRTVAGQLGLGLLVTDPGQAHLQAAAVLSGAMMAWDVEPGLGQLVELPRPPTGVPVGVVTGRRGAVQVAGGERVAVVELPMPDRQARRRFWTGAGLRAEPDVLDAISRRFVLSGGTIRRAATLAGAVARLDGRDLATVDDVRRASQEQGRQKLESLATLLPSLPDGFAPVLAGGAAESYETLVLRCRHRESLAAAVDGAAGGLVNRGVRALLSGPSGTGKTLSARALGSRLGLDVYRADLAALVDKYIGETERRLDNLFGTAEELDVILLVDEGDALMTRRTDVRSSNDRYANLETDYLLQRLETYEGVVLVTTNAPHLVDSAFQRRLDVTISFTLPGPAERLAIWRGHLPQRHAVTAPALERLATACRLTGGQIRNAAVHATLLAVDADRLVDDRCLVAAVERELTVAGKTSPLRDRATTSSSFEQAMAASVDGRTAATAAAGPGGRWR